MLQLRMCRGVTDRGIHDLCEGLSRLRANRQFFTEDRRYQVPRNHYSESSLRYLNIADNKGLTNKTM